MTAGDLLFWFLALSASLGAIAVVLTQNVVRMAFWLIVSLGSAAGLFFLLHADFVAAAQILVYVGGTVVLLIFGVMLTASGPYSQIKMSPGNVIAVSGLGAVVLFIVMQSVTSVNWDRSVLRQVAISTEKMEAIRDSVQDDEETLKLVESTFESSEVHGTQIYQCSADADLSTEEAAELLGALKANGLAFAPSTETGGTIRPLGFGLLGSRPDRDLNSPQGLESLSDGFYVRRASAPEEHADAEHGDSGHDDSKVALSTGYLLPFEIASVHLLVVLIGAAYLARAKRRVDAS